MSNPKIACPNCKSIFKVPANAVGDAGRRLSCSNCSHTWHAMPHELQYDKPIEAAIFVEELFTPPAGDFVGDLLASPVQSNDWLIEEQTNSNNLASNNLDNYIAGAEKTAAAVTQKVANKVVEKVIIVQQPATTEAETQNNDNNDNYDNGYNEFASLFSVQPITAPTPQNRPAFYGNVYALLAANFACFALICFVLLLSGRDAIIAKLPASSAFYRLIGYQQTDHLKIAEVQFTSSKSSNNEWRYVVKGKIINTANHASLVPIIRARIFDKRGDVLNEWELATSDNSKLEHVIPVKGDKTFNLKLPAKGNSAAFLAVDIGSNLELALRK